jgi:hypothetical protein
MQRTNLRENRLEIAKRNRLTLSQLDTIVRTVQSRREEAAVKMAEEERAKELLLYTLIGVVTVLNIPVFILIGRIVFGSWQQFWSDMRDSAGGLRLWATPEGRLANTKQLLFLLWCFSVVAAESSLLMRYVF